MKRLRRWLPLLVTLTAATIALLHGPIPQPADYHAFADRSQLGPIPHAADVLSNVGFLVVAVLGWRRLRPFRHHPLLATGWPGYRLMLCGLLLTAIGSAFYHWAPDNARLAWDRLPIALVCAGLLSGVWAETRPGSDGRAKAALLALLAVGSVAWWYFSELRGHGDVRAYLLLQMLPMVLIPLWQAIYAMPRAERVAIAAAVVLYAIAKLAESYDHELLALTGGISGHTLKHLAATAAAASIVGGLGLRIRAAALDARRVTARGESRAIDMRSGEYRRRV